jgi:hypothetical protein
MSTLEKRIAAALSSDSASTVLSALIAETEVAINQAAEAERAKALDPIVSPDAAKAHAAMEDAAFMRERLRTVLPRLQERYQEVVAQEYLARWREDYEALKIKRDELAAEFREIYPTCVSKIVDVLKRIAASEVELSQLHQVRPSGVSLHLLGAELVARGLDNFTRDDPSIVNELKLPDFEHSVQMAWPPPRPSMGAAFAATMLPASDRRFSAEWWQEREQGAARQRAEQQRIADYYARTTEEQEARENLEARERFVAHQPKNSV